MSLADLLSPDRIDVALDAADKRAALDAMASLLARGTAGVTAEAIARALHAREETATTGVGDEVAMPHGRVAGLKQLVAALALAPRGLEFDAVDGRPVKIVVAIVAPERAGGEHVRALAGVSRLLNDGAVRARLLDSRSPDDVLRIVRGDGA